MAQPAGEAEAVAPSGADAAEARTLATPAAEAAPATGGPWYRRRWAVVTGAVAAAVVLFLGGTAVGTTIDGNDRGDFRGDNGPGMLRDGGGEGFGHDGWGDNGQGMVPPGMGQGGQGHGWDRDGDDYGQPGYGQPSAAPTPAPSTSPLALEL